MAFNIGAIVSVQGEKEFNAAMSNMRQSMKYVSAEANVAMSVYGKNEKSVESLTARNAELKKALDVQKQGIKDIGKTIDELVANGLDPASDKYKQLKANLDNVTAAANKTELEIQENTIAMDELEQNSSGLGDSIAGIADKFGIVLPAGAQKGIEALNKVSASTIAFVGVAVKAVSTLAQYSVDAAKSADDILTLSSTTGMATDKIQELRYSSELLDVSFETVSGSMTKMIRSMNSARDGGNEAAEAYKNLGIRITGTDGQLRDANTVFYEAIDKLGKVKNETERDAIAMQLFGKSARELNPLIEAGSDRIKELADEAHEMGYVMSEDTLGKLGQLDDAFQRFAKQGEAVKNTLALALLPILTTVMQVISSIPPNVISVIAIVGTVIATVVAVVKSIKTVTDIMGAFSIESKKTTLIILGVVAALVLLAVAIAAITGKSKEFQQSMASIGTSVNGASRMAQMPHYAIGTSYHPGGLALVGESGPEIINLPRGSRVYSNAEADRMLLAGTSGGDVYNITIDAKNVKEFNDVVNLAQGARQARRARG